MACRYVLVFFTLGILHVVSTSQAQDLSQIGDTKPVKLSGGLSFNQIFYNTTQQESYREPYNYYLGGQLTLDIYGLALPFSFTYSNQQSQFRQPFNQFSVHPSYKWITGHFGYTSMAYSPYTLNGHIFEGGAITLKPTDKWEIGLMVGRLQKATPGDTVSTSAIPPAYQRMGYSLMVKYGTQLDYAKIVLFKSADNPNSLLPLNTDPTLLPEENLVGSLAFSKQFFKKLIIQGEFASSALSRDINSAAVETSLPGFPVTNFLFTPRESSNYYSAFNAAITYNMKTYNIGVKYERVGADYRTHGAYFFNNNFYNLSLNSKLSVFAGKVNMALSLGMQEDDLEETKVSKTKRLVGSLGLGISASEKLNLNLTYSNYTTYTNINKQYLDLSFLSPYEQLDTLNYSQVAQNLTAGANYSISRSKRTSQSLSANFTAMETRDTQSGTEQPSSSLFLTFNSSYNFSILPYGLNLAAIINLQKDISSISGVTIVGPTISVSKLFFEKTLFSSLAIAYNAVTGNAVGSTLNSRVSAGYRLKKAHNFQLSLISVRRERQGEQAIQISDVTGTLGYSYSF